MSNPKGNINITVSDGQGQTVAIKVPVTFIPVDLTTQATKKSLLNSPAFRRMVATKYLKLISNDEANEIMDTPEARTEADRVYSITMNTMEDVSATAPEDAKRAIAETNGTISGLALNLAEGNGMDEDQILSTLRNNESSMSRDDFAYIAETSQHARVKSRAAEMLVNQG